MNPFLYALASIRFANWGDLSKWTTVALIGRMNTYCESLQLVQWGQKREKCPERVSEFVSETD